MCHWEVSANVCVCVRVCVRPFAHKDAFPRLPACLLCFVARIPYLLKMEFWQGVLSEIPFIVREAEQEGGAGVI